MASEIPDPQTLKSWKEAFQYPIPTVRRVEQELRRDIASNKEKLRALVGTRYRELLGTAETIVAMNREIQQVDSSLADIGHRCNPRLIEKNYTTHVAQIKSEARTEDAEKQTAGAQLALLHRSTTLISKLLRKKSSPLLIAKLVVVSRLIHKTLSEQQTMPPFLETLRNQLATLRQTLLRRVDKRLAAASSTTEDILETLAAYCLATSSSSDGAINHFHKVRLDGISSQLALNNLSDTHVLKALKLYIRTLQTTKVLLSRRLSDTLGKLKARPILSDPEIRALDNLDIDILGRWVAVDVKNFTPWIKTNEMSKAESEKVMKTWSTQALDRFVSGCQDALATWNDFSGLIALRRKTLEGWLSSKASTPTHSSLAVLDGIRKVFNESITRLLSTQAQALEHFGQQVSLTITTWDEVEHSGAQSLWDSKLLNFEYSNGAAGLKQVITDRLLGRDENVNASLKNYQTWLADIRRSGELLAGLRVIKWNEIIDEYDDEDPDLDVATILNEDDPRLLWDALKEAIGKSFENLQAAFGTAFDMFETSNQSGKSTFMLRLIRQIRRDAPAEFMEKRFIFAQSIVPALQKMLTTEVVNRTDVQKLNFGNAKRVPGRTLWEGEPSLPSQPSPNAFRYLRRLMSLLEELGQDLWDPSTMQVLRDILDTELSATFKAAYGNTCKPPATATNEQHQPAELETTDKPDRSVDDQDSQDTRTEDHIRDIRIQLLFDILFLQNALAPPAAASTKLGDMVVEIKDSLDLDSTTTEGLKKTATEYWKRTQLLFGLLVAESN
ncbi:hypothetical protein ASPZODRAFT_102627 [Penicilliopsis zonata CBS 506.65]|uniref:Conserved oligomeric Golgi complex subunit 1 n=1 Tax=Penicilliopsis zonata CBS 506.65 TaxID=1073090 RepID=A0A1L9S9K5_9EURO|nr:hypothetical protein ASPZODRAFT_102627 [Penicilliopsis zonata CBS 506.65]OJJ43818.1 hypothetical protein ASPZODRAFT_102627 [Penicilliopsis zonata CBS 506.65]